MPKIRIKIEAECETFKDAKFIADKIYELSKEVDLDTILKINFVSVTNA